MRKWKAKRVHREPQKNTASHRKTYEAKGRHTKAATISRMEPEEIHKRRYIARKAISEIQKVRCDPQKEMQKLN